MTKWPIWLGSLALVVVAAMGCGGSNTGQPSTPTATSELTLGATGTPVAPHASPPQAGAGIAILGDGVLEVTIVAHEGHSFDPLSLAAAAGIEPPPCAAFVFPFTWQVRDPYPPEGVDLRLQATRQGATEDVGAGPSGEITLGCVTLEIVNDGSTDVVVEMRYIIGAFSR